jgi:hypothetical protein
MRTQFGRFGLLLANDSKRPNIVRIAKHSLHIPLNVAKKVTDKIGNHGNHGKRSKRGNTEYG